MANQNQQQREPGEKGRDTDEQDDEVRHGQSRQDSDPEADPTRERTGEGKRTPSGDEGADDDDLD